MNDSLCLWVLEHLDQPLDFVLVYCILLLDCRKRCSRCSVTHCVVASFNNEFSNRLMVPMMILRLGFEDLADQIASSLLSTTRGTLGVNANLLTGAHPGFSYIPLSQCKLQAVCCGDRRHVTVFGKIASLSLERTSNSTKMPYFEGVSQYSVYGAILGLVKIAWNFSYTMSISHWVHGCEEYLLFSTLEACSSWNESMSY